MIMKIDGLGIGLQDKNFGLTDSYLWWGCKNSENTKLLQSNSVIVYLGHNNSSSKIESWK